MCEKRVDTHTHKHTYIIMAHTYNYVLTHAHIIMKTHTHTIICTHTHVIIKHIHTIIYANTHTHNYPHFHTRTATRHNTYQQLWQIVHISDHNIRQLALVPVCVVASNNR